MFHLKCIKEEPANLTKKSEMSGLPTVENAPADLTKKSSVSSNTNAPDVLPFTLGTTLAQDQDPASSLAPETNKPTVPSEEPSIFVDPPLSFVGLTSREISDLTDAIDESKGYYRVSYPGQC